MKILIKEQRLNNVIEKYILEGYPMVKSVTVSTIRAFYHGTPDETPVHITKIIIGFISNKLTHSPNWTIKEIKNKLNSMFNLEIGKKGSKWMIDYKIESLTGER
jgi:hypothetical protein